MQKQYNQSLDDDCHKALKSIRKIGLTPGEKRAIFHFILNLGSIQESKAEELEVPANPSL